MRKTTPPDLSNSMNIRRNLSLTKSHAVAATHSAPGTRHPALPDLIIVDGGKGQLSAACRELQRLGLHELPIIGLAKEFEEIIGPAGRCRCGSRTTAAR